MASHPPLSVGVIGTRIKPHAIAAALASMASASAFREVPGGIILGNTEEMLAKHMETVVVQDALAVLEEADKAVREGRLELTVAREPVPPPIFPDWAPACTYWEDERRREKGSDRYIPQPGNPTYPSRSGNNRWAGRSKQRSKRKMKNKSKKRNRAFTLIEVLVVVVMLAIMGGIAYSVVTQWDKALEPTSNEPAHVQH